MLNAASELVCMAKYKLVLPVGFSGMIVGGRGRGPIVTGGLFVTGFDGVDGLGLVVAGLEVDVFCVLGWELDGFRVVVDWELDDF